LDETVATAIAPFLFGARIQVLDLAAMDEASLRALPLPAMAKLAFLCQQLLARRDPDRAEACLRRWADLLAEAQAVDYNVRLLSSYVLRRQSCPRNVSATCSVS
jgi:hypothetical protein